MAHDRADRMAKPNPPPLPQSSKSGEKPGDDAAKSGGSPGAASAGGAARTPDDSSPRVPKHLEPSSISRLLAMPDESFDIDTQARTLKQAAYQKPLAQVVSAPTSDATFAHAPTVRMPAPFELSQNAPRELTAAPGSIPPPPLPPSFNGPAGALSSSPLSMAASPSEGMPAAPMSPASKPPPLPPRMGGAQAASLKAPPPLPPGANARPPSKFPPPLPASSRAVEGPGPKVVRAPDSVGLGPAAIMDLLSARASTLEGADDPVGLARVHLELALVSDAVLAEDARAVQHAENALKTSPHLVPAHALLRRRKHGRAGLPQMLAHLDQELAASTSERAVVEMLVEKASLMGALGTPALDARADAVRAAWEQALARSPDHPGAMKGLEALLVERALQAGGGAGERATWDALATHLGHVADVFSAEPSLAAWLHVERARILEGKLGRVDAARGALDHALALDPRVGPVRDAVVRHVATHDDALALSMLLEQEAELENHPERAPRATSLDLEAATIANVRLGDTPRAVRLLQRAASRAPTAPTTDRQVLDKLIELLEAATDWPHAETARRARLRFITEPATLAHELRALALLNERIGDLERATADAQRALALESGDPTLIDLLDRFLAVTGKDEQRMALWVSEAARTEDGTKRARALGRAASIAESELGRATDAVRHLRAAWVAAPGDSEVLDQLARLLSPTPSKDEASEARALVDLYAQAAEHARDPARRVAYLEKTAVLWEEVMGDPRQAARVYSQILTDEPDRRGAILGLGRCAGRLGDERMLARALLDEARLSDDGVTVLALRTRAAATLAKSDAARAFALVSDVLQHDPQHSAGRALETRLHEEAGRWELAAESLRARIGIVTQPAEKVSLWLALAQIQDARLRAPRDALASLQAARSADPTHPVPPEAIARLLAATGDFDSLRAAQETLASNATSPAERARFLVQAAEIDDLRLGESGRAARLYARALAEMPDDEMIADRLARVLVRRTVQSTDSAATALTDLSALIARRIEQSSHPGSAEGLSFTLASLLVELGRDLPRAATLLEQVLVTEPDHIPALRTLELVARMQNDASALAKALSLQGDAFEEAGARRASLWNLAWLEEWRLPNADALPTYHRIRELDPTDSSALDAIARREQAGARRGEPRARKAMLQAMRGLVALAPDEWTRFAHQLRLALSLEVASEQAASPTRAGPDPATGSETSPPALAREALDRYRDALRLDPLSVTASTGLARLSTKFNDAESAVAAAMALAELTIDARVRSRYLLDAADLLVTTSEADDRLGPRDARRARAATLLEKALDADPDSIAAAGRLATLLLEPPAAGAGPRAAEEAERNGTRLIETFRAAIRRAHSAEAIVMLGSEIARVARDDLHDLTLAIDTMRKVREAAPNHVPSLLTLAELCIAQRSWPEAVEALEAVVTIGHDIAPKLTALFALASIYEKVLSRSDETERVLRQALTFDPQNARALRALLRFLSSPPTPASGAPPREASARELADLLQRLCDVEKDPAQRSPLLFQLAELRINLDDIPGAERCLIESVALDPLNAKAFARLASLFRNGAGRDHASYARALAQVIARGQQHGHVDARWFAALGHIEVETLGRLKEGLAHLQRAVQLDPGMFETRFELASTLAKLGANEDAARTIMQMIVPNAAPLMAVSDPGAALELLEAALAAERRPEEALVVSELRAVAGDLDDGRHAWLRARRLGPVDAHHQTLDRPTLVTHVLPSEGRHILLEVAAAMTGIEAKMFRSDISELGIANRDRVSSRSGHPTKLLLDRVAKSLGISDVELVVTPSVVRARVLAQDVPWIVVPRTLTEAPEPTQLAAIARALARIALGVPWLEELPPPHIEAFLIASARQVVPNYGADQLDIIASKLVVQYETSVAKHISRRQRKLLDELAPHLASPAHAPMPTDVFIGALSRAELRVAYLLTGDLLASIDELRGIDASFLRATDSPGRAALGATLDHPSAGDLARFALTPEATALRRRVGAAWTG